MANVMEHIGQPIIYKTIRKGVRSTEEGEIVKEEWRGGVGVITLQVMQESLTVGVLLVPAGHDLHCVL